MAQPTTSPPANQIFLITGHCATCDVSYYKSGLILTLLFAPHPPLPSFRSTSTAQLLAVKTTLFPASTATNISTFAAMLTSQTKRHKAWLRYKLLSSDLFQQIEGRGLQDIATWPVEERAEYHKFLITGLHRNRLCMEERMRYKFAYVPREKWDDEHERAIDWAKGNIVRFQSLLADLAVALQSVPQPPEPPQSDPELNAEVGAEPARPKSRGKRKAGKKVMAKVDIIFCFCFLFLFLSTGSR
jgi:hypothetical protein